MYAHICSFFVVEAAGDFVRKIPCQSVIVVTEPKAINYRFVLSKNTFDILTL